MAEMGGPHSSRLHGLLGTVQFSAHQPRDRTSEQSHGRQFQDCSIQYNNMYHPWWGVAVYLRAIVQLLWPSPGYSPRHSVDDIRWDRVRSIAQLQRSGGNPCAGWVRLRRDDVSWNCMRKRHVLPARARRKNRRVFDIRHQRSTCCCPQYVPPPTSGIKY